MTHKKTNEVIKNWVITSFKILSRDVYLVSWLLVQCTAHIKADLGHRGSVQKRSLGCLRAKED